MNLDTIETGLRDKAYTPHVLAEWKAFLAGQYSYQLGMLETILGRKSVIWAEIRKNVGSDKSADRAYEGTQDGVDEMKIRLTMKRYEKLSSAISSLLRVYEQESRNVI